MPSIHITGSLDDGFPTGHWSISSHCKAHQNHCQNYTQCPSFLINRQQDYTIENHHKILKSALKGKNMKQYQIVPQQAQKPQTAAA